MISNRALSQRSAHKDSDKQSRLIIQDLGTPSINFDTPFSSLDMPGSPFYPLHL